MERDGAWIIPGTGERIAEERALARLSEARVVLLGERHDSAADHAWQRRILAELAERRFPLLVGFEMFPRSAARSLDAWTKGALSAEAFLEAVRWGEVWGFAPDLYMPLFELCRARGLPMRGINIDRDLVRAIGRDGWDAVPRDQRDWLSPARPASPAYRSYLFAITGGRRPGRAAQSPEDPAFDRFVRAQQAWDRAFACALAEIAAQTPQALVAGLIGRGHLEFGLGVADQLDDLGVARVATALPGGDERNIADLVFLHSTLDREQDP